MNTPSPITIQPTPPQLRHIDPDVLLADKEEYLTLLKKWQKRMKVIQQAYYHQRRRAIIILEGWDGGGKGGAIRRLTEALDPRGFNVYPISAPDKVEQGKHYLYRFQCKTPSPGTLAIFDRSYYGRVLVERVEGFASKPEWQRAYQELNEYERTLSDDGVRIIKLFMHISANEQLKRFEERLNNPLKRWKLTQEDIRNRSQWHAYEMAIEEMFARTSTQIAPWNVVPGNHKWYARVKTLQTVVEVLERGVSTEPPVLDPEIIEAARTQLGIQIKV